MMTLIVCGCAKSNTSSGVPPASVASVLSGNANISGSGSSDIGTMNITHNYGTIQIDHTSYPSYIYTLVDWQTFDQTIYQGIAADNSHFFVFFIYCNDQNQIDTIYWEGINGPAITMEPGSGTCNYSPTDTWPAPSAAAQSYFANLNFQAILPQAFATGFNITGSDLNYSSGSPGHLTTELSGGSRETFNVYPFGTVDCSHDCGTPGWYELHSLLVDPISQKSCFAIVYLLTDPKATSIDYWICLSDLSQPSSTQDGSATWSQH